MKTAFLSACLCFCLATSYSQTPIRVKLVAISGKEASMYMGCGNEIKAVVENATGQAPAVSLTSSEGATVKSLGDNKFIIVPVKFKFSVTAAVNGNPVETFSFNVRQTPIPHPKILVDGVRYDSAKGLTLGASSLEITPETYEEFVSSAPKDAAYKIVSMRVKMTDHDAVTLTSGILDLTRFKLKSGDDITIDDFKIERPTWDGGVKPVNAFRMNCNFKIGK